MTATLNNVSFAGPETLHFSSWCQIPEPDVHVYKNTVFYRRSVSGRDAVHPGTGLPTLRRIPYIHLLKADSTLKKEAARFSETLAPVHHNTWRHTAEEHN